MATPPVRRTAALSTLGSALLLSACATAPAPPTSETHLTGGPSNVRVQTRGAVSEDTVPASPDDAWQGLQQVYASMEIPVSGVREEERRLETMHVVVRRIDGDRVSAFVDCGSGLSGPRVNSHDVSLVVVSSVRSAAGDGTILRVEVDAWAQPRGGMGSSIHCRSTNQLEARILGNLTLWLASARRPDAAPVPDSGPVP